MDHHNSGEIIKNYSSSNATPQVLEGGFLSGRNPFIFNSHFPLPTFIIQLLVIICMSRLVKLILSPIRQPAVIAEIISGILLGPTALGHIPYFTTTIFPKVSLPFLNLVSNFGLVLFLFLVGLELDPRMLRKSVKKSLAISLAGMMLPFGVGVGTSYALYTYIEPPNHTATFTTYFLFLGVAMAITAFPVLARILTELNLLKTKVGSITVSAAAVDDATSWCLLALVISLINAGSGLVALYVFLIGLAYSLVLILGIRPIYIWILRRSGAFEGEPSQLVMFFTLGLVFISAFITDAIGIHAIFGGFLAGIVMPHEGGFAYHITEKLEDIVAVLFLPLYFALSGLRTQIGSLDDGISWAMVLLVIFVACFGKICGCTLAARASSMSWRESFTVGALMNCKGLVELIVLNLGYDAHVISDRTFAIMVIMALVTTFLTVPLVTFIYPPKYHDKVEEELPLSTGKTANIPTVPSILVSVNKIEQVPSILSVIDLLESRYGQKSDLSTSSLSPTGPNCLPILSKRGSAGSETSTYGYFNSSSKLVVNALRLIEITERDSSVMLQTSQDALRDDPVMKMLQTFCEITALDVRGLIKVVTINNFAETLNKTAYEVNATFIIIPWVGSGSLVEDTSTPIQQLFLENKRRHSIHTPIQHANFIQDLLSTATSSVLILVDRGLELNKKKCRASNVGNLIPHYKQIFLPFFGGSDDRQALEIVLGISGQSGVQITVVRFKSAQPRSNSYADSDIGSSGGLFERDTMPHAQYIVPDSADDLMLGECFGTEELRSRYANLTYSEVETFAPMTSALQHTGQLTSKDLVVLGRQPIVQMSTIFGGLNLKGADPERRKVLGDVAESFLLASCASSVLVVQGREKRLS